MSPTRRQARFPQPIGKVSVLVNGWKGGPITVDRAAGEASTSRGSLDPIAGSVPVSTVQRPQGIRKPQVSLIRAARLEKSALRTFTTSCYSQSLG